MMSRRRVRTAQQTFFAVSKSFETKQNWISRAHIVAAETYLMIFGSSAEKYRRSKIPFFVLIRANERLHIKYSGPFLRETENIACLVTVFWCREEGFVDCI
jgi:hypothetical protein